VRTLVLTIILSGISVVIGVGLANIIQPGKHLSDEKRSELRDGTSTKPVPRKHCNRPKRPRTCGIPFSK
jgi:Na+/H+-dicarboxylate symporter